MIRISIPSTNESLPETLVAEIQRAQQASGPSQPILRVRFDDAQETLEMVFGDHQAQVVRFPQRPVGQQRRAA